MSKLTWILVGIGVVAIAAIATVKRQNNPPSPPAATTAQSAEIPAPSANPPPSANPLPPSSSASVSAPEPAEEDHSGTAQAGEPATASLGIVAPDTSAAKPSVTANFSQPLQTLVSPQASFAQKQAAWKQIRDAGQLDEAIAQLKQAVKDDPSVAAYSAALGQAYLQKLGTTQDVRQQAILAMEADQTFDQALTLDPNNWDARFSKASALAHWPAELNKSQEIMENLSTLIDQQEARAPQPEYAQSYVLLGDQYLKAGYPDNAQQMWQRGAALFPNNEALQNKLASSR
ncbi:MAG: tetratricopeptide repeat protein [Verrucomicrobiia bacterium]